MNKIYLLNVIRCIRTHCFSFSSLPKHTPKHNNWTPIQSQRAYLWLCDDKHKKLWIPLQVKHRKTLASQHHCTVIIRFCFVVEQQSPVVVYQHYGRVFSLTSSHSWTCACVYTGNAYCGVIVRKAFISILFISIIIFYPNKTQSVVSFFIV